MMDHGASISYTRGMNTSKADAKVSMSQLGGLRGFIRNPGLFLYTLRRGGHVGRDALGNQYYERPGRTKTARTRRWVVYTGAPDASTIGPEWHSWLHHLTDKPLPDTGAKPWQRPHQPNLTGTPASYRPAGHDYEGGKRAPASADYESWTPDNS
jgi:NADH:ubiquinone oxidoreductase subunit